MREGPYCPADLADGDSFAGAREPLAIAPHLVVPERERQSERGWFGVDAVRAADLRRVLEFKRTALEHLEQGVDLPQQNVAGVAQQQRVGCIDHIGRSQAIVNKPGSFAD